MATNYNPGIVTSGLVLCLDAGNIKSYPGSGSSWTDLSGNGNTGTLINSPTYSSSNGGILVFNGSNTYVDTAIKLFTAQQFTISFWIKPNSFSGNYCSGAVSNSLYSIFGTTSGYQGFTNTFSAGIQTAAGGNAVGTVNQSNYSTGIFYHYCAVYDGTQTGNAARLKLYINGISKTLTYDSTIPSTPYNNNSNTRIGFGPGSPQYPYFDGSISNVSYYNGILSETEIINNFNALRGRFGL